MASRATFNADSGQIVLEGDQLPIAVARSDFAIAGDRLPESFKHLQADADAIAAANGRRLVEAFATICCRR
jgi:hypothetical protein